MKEKLIFGSLAVLMLGGLGVFVYFESKPLPTYGQKFEDLGRTHMQIGETVEYNSNPPTSGNHYPEWTKAGAFDTIKDDRNLLHSLEHGYIIMTYKCPGVGASIFNSPTESTASAQSGSDDCKQRYDQLKTIYEAKGQRKLIVVPRENMDTNFAVTAWTRMDSFNEFDKPKIERFVDAYFDQGPEKTME
jgi:hypothetical protein